MVAYSSHFNTVLDKIGGEKKQRYKKNPNLPTDLGKGGGGILSPTPISRWVWDGDPAMAFQQSKRL